MKKIRNPQMTRYLTNMAKFIFTKRNRNSIFESLSEIDWSGMYDYISSWPDGIQGYITFHKIGQAKSQEQLGYYYAVILPEAVKAFRNNEDFSLVVEFKGKQTKMELTLNNMDYFLKLRYAALTGEYVDKSEMNMAQCAAFEDWAIKWLATWLGCQIPPADRDWRKRKKDEG